MCVALQYGCPEVGGVKHVPPGWNSWVALVRLELSHLSLPHHRTKLLHRRSLPSPSCQSLLNQTVGCVFRVFGIGTEVLGFIK